MIAVVALVVPLLVGVLVGAVAAVLHQRASWRASCELSHSGRASSVLWGLPLRVGLPALALFLLARWRPVAMIAAFVAFGVVAWLAARSRLTREDR